MFRVNQYNVNVLMKYHLIYFYSDGIYENYISQTFKIYVLWVTLLNSLAYIKKNVNIHTNCIL